MKQSSARVLSNGEVLPGTYLMWLESPEMAEQARPGQFVMVWCGEETVLRRPLSFHRVGSGRFALLFRVIGLGTRWLAGRRMGDALDIIGPLGNGFRLSPESRRILLVAGGMGIAPLCFLGEAAAEQGRHVTLLCGTANGNRYSVPTCLKEVAATEDGSIGHKGMVTDLIAHYIGGVDQVFACGPPAMYRAMAVMPCLEGVLVQVSLETRMGCGRGVCYACTVKTRDGVKQVCTDGPVFGLDEVVWREFSD